MLDLITKMVLMPCPYCGKDVATVVSAKEMEWCKHFDSGDDDDSEYETCPIKEPFETCPYTTVVCDVEKGGCGASTGYAGDRLKAISKWNRRSYEDKNNKQADNK